MQLRVEFTVEPFVEGDPGPHVRAAVAAVADLGVDPEVGPFGTAFEADAATASEAVASLVRAAAAAGAGRVSLQVTTI